MYFLPFVLYQSSENSVRLFLTLAYGNNSKISLNEIK